MSNFYINILLQILIVVFYYNVSHAQLSIVDESYCHDQTLIATTETDNIRCKMWSMMAIPEVFVGFSYSKETRLCRVYGMRYRPLNVTKETDIGTCYFKKPVPDCLNTDKLDQVIPIETFMEIRQSSIYGKGYSKKAFDGNLTTFAGTNLEKGKPWLGIHLRGIFVIHKVVITNRDDTLNCDRLHDVRVTVGWKWPSNENDIDSFSDEGQCGEILGGGFKAGEKLEIQCTPRPVFGKYVFIQIMKLCNDCRETTGNILNLAEVTIYGCPEPITGNS